MEKKKIGDLMVDLFELPHIPYWFTIKQAMGIFKKSFLDEQKGPHLPIILIFDEKCNLVGMVSMVEALKGLQPEFLKGSAGMDNIEEDETALAMIWDTVFDANNKRLSQCTVSEIMTPVGHYVRPDEPVTKAAYLMLHRGLPLLPVINERDKLVGIIRLSEIFFSMAETV